MNIVLNFLQKLPIAKWIKPLWKGGLKTCVQQCGDYLQTKADKELAAGIDAALPKINALVDGYQDEVAGLIDRAPMPPEMREQAKDAIASVIDKLQDRLNEAAAAGAAGAVKDAFDAAFDKFQVELIARIDSL